MSDIRRTMIKKRTYKEKYRGELDEYYRRTPRERAEHVLPFNCDHRLVSASVLRTEIAAHIARAERLAAIAFACGLRELDDLTTRDHE